MKDTHPYELNETNEVSPHLSRFNSLNSFILLSAVNEMDQILAVCSTVVAGRLRLEAALNGGRRVYTRR
jgi:hypothetical protein